MSDIFVKSAGATGGTTGWRKASRIWAKTAGYGSTGWREATGVWIKNATQWLKVWPISGIFASRVPFIADFSFDAYADRLTTASRLRIGTSYFGDNAVWDLNGFAASNYTYKWKLYDQFGQDLSTVLRSGTGSGWTSSTGEDQLPSSIWTSTNSTNSDEKYLGFECTANASNGATYNGVSVSSKIKVIRQSPLNSTYSLSSLTPVVGTQLTYSSTWSTGEAYKARTTTIGWYSNSTNSTTGGSLLTTGSTYTPVSADVGKYIYVTETRVNSGSDFDYGIDVGVSVSVITTSVVTEISNQATGSKRRVNLNSNFTSGTTIYVSTNGFISIGYDPATSISIPASGEHLAILRGDHAQTALYYYSDEYNFYVRWQGYRLGNTGRTIDYQAKFAWGSTIVDVFFITNNLIPADYDTYAVVQNGTVTSTWAGSTSAAISAIATSSMTRNTSKDSVDDGRTEIVASIPLQAPTLIYLGNPVVSRTSNTYSYSTTTGSWNNSPTSYSYQWYATEYLPYPPYVSTIAVGTNSSTYTSSSSYDNFNIYCSVIATNAAGSSSAASSNSIQNTPVAAATAPSQPGTPTNGWIGGTTYPFSWTASASAGTVTGGGEATITKYGISIYEASGPSGSGAVWKGSFYTANGSTLSYTYTSPNASKYYAASTWAVNSANKESTASPLSAFK